MRKAKHFRMFLVVAAVVGAAALGLGARQADAYTVHSFGELLAPGYQTQSIDNYPSYDFTVEGQTPVLDYYFGFLKGNYVVGYLDTYPGYPQYLVGKYNGDPSVVNPSQTVLNIGERPDFTIVIEDTDSDGIIGDLTGGVFTVDSGDRFWMTSDMEFNGTPGAISEMPAYTGTSDTLTVPSVNLVPEPASLAFLGIGAGLIWSRRIKELGGKRCG